MIFDHLFFRHTPDKALYEADHDWRYTDEVDMSTCNQPLDYLSASCKLLRAEINDWAIHFMTTHSDITKFQMPKTAKKDKTFNMLRGRKGLLSWAYIHCMFCGKKSSRNAILMNGLRCCAKCDKAQWPDKITKTAALDEYNLKDRHLFLHRKHDSHMPLTESERRLPRTKYGVYRSTGVLTHMFLRKDVERLAAALHGDLDAHLAKRKVDREERKKKMEEKREARRAADEAALAQIAGGSADNPLDIED